MYGFPESHAASFALIAYASAYLKVYYLAAFTCGLLNNQPMGFYSPAVLIKDAQRHGLRVRPIDVLRSEWLCTLETEPDVNAVSKGHEVLKGYDALNGVEVLKGHDALNGVEVLKGHDFSRAAEHAILPGALAPEAPILRIGLNYVKGLRQSSAEALLEARNRSGPFKTVDEMAARVPVLNRKELVALARVGALNSLGEVEHRRDALWQVEQAGRPVGPLLRDAADPSETHSKPLKKMTHQERMTADFAGTGLTTGPHPMAYERAELKRKGFWTAAELEKGGTNRFVRVAGSVIARQRPGTAKGFVFLSLEDETGIANIIVTPDIFENNRIVTTRSRFLQIEGKLQNQDGVIHVKAQRLEPLHRSAVDDATAPNLARNWH
jgi:error-prone DNA polymerase